MTKNPVLYPHFNRQTMTDLKRAEKIFLKDIERAEEDLVRLKARAEEVRKEINFRTIPDVQQMKRDITKLERMIENHESGKTPLSATKLKNVQHALKVVKEAFNTLLLYGGDGYTSHNRGDRDAQ
jgi:predicted  nucleic acid-binding Zn-ribbon protein